MPRVCFTLQVDPSSLNEYVQVHRAVWPEMLAAIRDAGRRNYSLFVRHDGFVVGYYETDDDAASARALAQDPRTALWESVMAPFFVSLDGARADQNAPHLTEVFNLADQCEASDLSPT